MALFERVHLPSFAGATEWLNTEPLGTAELEGHVVLVNFWTLTCINWLRQEPYVRAWSQAYRDDAEAHGRLGSLETACHGECDTRRLWTT